MHTRNNRPVLGNLLQMLSSDVINPRRACTVGGGGGGTVLGLHVCLCLTIYFSDTVSRNEGTNGFSATRSTLLGFSFIQKLWRHLLTYRGTAATFCVLFSKGPKKANNGLNTTWNTT